MIVWLARILGIVGTLSNVVVAYMATQCVLSCAIALISSLAVNVSSFLHKGEGT